MIRKIAAPWGLSAEGKLKRNILIQIDELGVLNSVEFEVRDFDSVYGLEYYNGILIPSMTNAHCHLELSHMRGKIKENGENGIVDFFEGISAYGKYSDPLPAISTQDKLMWDEGISLVGDISNKAISFDIKSRSKIKYRTFIEYYGYTDYLFQKAKNVLMSASDFRIDASLSPHSTYLVSDKLFKESHNQKFVSIHFMESKTETGFFDGKGKMFDFVTSSYGDHFSQLPYKSATDRVVKSIDPDVHLLLVHCTCMKEEDILILREHFKNLTFVLCPYSNLYIENAVPPAKLLYDMDCSVAIGTDSLSSNYSLYLGKEISKLCSYGVPLEKVLCWATSDGSRALGYSQEFGTFQKGKRSGAVLINGINLNTFKVNDIQIKRIV